MKLLTLIFLAVAVLASPYPGVRTSIGISSLNQLLQAKLPIVISDIISKGIPDTTFNEKFLMIPMTLKLKNLTIEVFSIDVKNSELEVNNQTGQLYLTLRNFNLFLTGIYTYYIPLPIAGFFNVSMTDATVILPVSLSTTVEGEILANIAPLEGNLTSLIIDIEAKNTFSSVWILLSHLWPLSTYMNKIVVDTIDSISKRLNPPLAKFFDSIRYTDVLGSLPIAGDYHFYSMNLNPLSIDSNLNGTFFLINALGEESNVVPPSIIPNMIGVAPIRVQFTEYYFDSLMWAMYSSGSLSFYIKSENMPKNIPYTFTTTGLSKVVPNLAKVYGANLPVDLQCAVYKVPNIDIQVTVSASLDVNCNFIVRVGPNAKITAFTIITQIITQFSASINNQNGGIYMIASLDNTNTEFSEFSLLNSNIGVFSLTKLAGAFNYYMYALVLKANTMLETTGIRLPLPEGIQVQKAAFNIYQGAAEIDFQPVFG
ncbi:hypothetical protein SteCoe_59 [Stentor coeruleus]|uniref:Lipid-binding serum glycoprotein C-terminal domain-containing protein n=1 Tax=Stentor coeruleus TaxID=5963 RepID=A0A1R2D4X0_9CILI|nr:hypothetical protein SteCoe_59 [Stentor coeruleus]